MLTSERRMEHPFAGQNTQQSIFRVFHKKDSSLPIELSITRDLGKMFCHL